VVKSRFEDSSFEQDFEMIFACVAALRSFEGDKSHVVFGVDREMAGCVDDAAEDEEGLVRVVPSCSVVVICRDGLRCEDGWFCYQIAGNDNTVATLDFLPWCAIERVEFVDTQAELSRRDLS
jgi:hypothetical protein